MRLVTGSESAPLMSTLTASSRIKRWRKLDNCRDETSCYKYIFCLSLSFILRRSDVTAQRWSCDPVLKIKRPRAVVCQWLKGSVCIGCDMKYSLRY